ncbi:MAG: MFS transporter [Steroidobacteraceae bacterium]
MPGRSSMRAPAFAAFRQRGYRGYLLGNAGAMLADNTEHVISYWVIFQKFHSPALAGFAVISHWLPFLLLSGYAGALADRVNTRRMIQLGMLIFMGVSLGWGLLFMGGHMQIWQAWILLALHGVAGVLWTAPSQLLLHDIVGPKNLQSAVRLSSSSRYLGTLLGPALGSGLLLWLGPVTGIFLNALVYLPTIWWLNRQRYGTGTGGAVGAGAARQPGAVITGLPALVANWHSMKGNRQIASMTLLCGCAALFVGTAYQAQLPGFAEALGHGHPGIAYFALLAADAAGAVSAGLVLEFLGLLPASARGALILAMGWSLCIASFALTHSYALALPLLFAAGFCELSFNAMAQTLVQLHSPAGQRGRIIGLFITVSLGLRAVSGITVGLAGALIGVHASLALSAMALLLCVVAIARWQGAAR